MRHGVVNQIIEKILNFKNEGGYIYFVTLTLRDERVESTITKDVISDFIKKLKCRSVEIAGYIWAKELQRRGVVHYHVVLLTLDKLRHAVVEEAWRKGFVWVQRVVTSNDKMVRKIVGYVFKYINKEGKDKNNGNDKMKRRMGRGGILRFRVVKFYDRVAQFSEFQYVGGLYYKGFRVKFYRLGKLIMMISTGVRGCAIDIFEYDMKKVMEKMKYLLPSMRRVTKMVNTLGFQLLKRDEIRDIYGYHRFSRSIDWVLYFREIFKYV
ncbi:MAG: hypothetical protein P3W91_001010 [Fervidobacterium sp.]|nr:hypothetical protein [Fervidobacterium sp.]